MGGKVENALYLINGGVYLHITDSGDRFDYTIYDKETMRQVYHGQLNASTVCKQPAQGIFNAARCAVFEDCGINAVTVEAVSLDMLQKLKNIQRDPPLDEYPRPALPFWTIFWHSARVRQSWASPLSSDSWRQSRFPGDHRRPCAGAGEIPHPDGGGSARRRAAKPDRAEYAGLDPLYGGGVPVFPAAGLPGRYVPAF